MLIRIIVFFLAVQLISAKAFSQSVSINTNGNAADTSAMLDIASINKGVLIPRMTQAQRNAIYAPADGLLIYQTDASKGVYYYHTGIGWTLLTSTSNVWSQTGNGSTTASNFIGTTDLKSLRFRTNNVQGMMLDSLGNLNLGNAPVLNSGNPDKLLVDGGSTAGSPASSFNLITGKGLINNYLQMNTQNKSNGTNASSDVVATADNGDETTNYVNMGINSSGNTAGYYGGANDAYVYNLGQNLLIGTGTAGKTLAFLTGGGTQATNERMRIDGTGNVGIGTNNPTTLLDVNGTVKIRSLASGAATDSIVTADASGNLKRRSLASLISGTSTTNILTSSANTITNTTNGVSASAPIVNSVINTSAVNNLTTTVNGVATTAVPIVNSISNTSTGNTLSTTVNGVAGTAVNIVNTNTLTSAANTMTNTTNGIAASAPIVNSISNTSSGNSLATLVNGVAGATVSMVNSNTLSLSGNTLTSTVNGIAATGSTVSTVAGSLTGNNLTVSVNGVNSSAINLSTLNAVDSTTASNGVSLVSKDVRLGGALTGATTITTTGTNTLALAGLQSGVTTDSIVVANATTGVLGRRSVNAVVSGATTNTLSSTTNTMTNTTNGVTATAPIVNTVSNTSAGNNLTTTINGVAGTAVTMVNTVANNSTANTLTTTVNGVAGTAVNLVNTNTLTSSANTMTNSTNGVSASANIVNSNALSISGTLLTSTVNGVASSALSLPFISSLNTLTGTSQNFALGTSGSDVNIASSGTTHTFNFPDAGTFARGLVTTGAQTFAGNKTFNGNIIVDGGAANDGTFSNGSGIRFGWSGSGEGIVSKRTAGGNTSGLDFLTASTSRLSISNAGLVGINNTAPGSTLDVKGTLRLSGSTSGYVGFAPAAAAGSTTYTLPAADGAAGQQLTTNGAGLLTWTNQTAATTVSNNSSANTLSTTVNGVAGANVNLINSNATSLSGTNLTTTINGVASAALDLSPAIAVRSWSNTGNSINSGSNFLGTTNNSSLRLKTNNVERMVVDSLGNVGYGIAAPTYRTHFAGGDANTSVGTPSSANMLAGFENTAGGATMCDIKTTNGGNTFILRWGINPVFTGGTTPVVPGMVGVGGWSGIYNGVVSQYLTYDFVNKNVILAPPNQINNVGVGTNTPNSTFSNGGSLSVAYRTVSGGQTISGSDYVVINTGTSATWSLPAASSCAGRVYKLVNHGSGNLTLSQSVTIGNGSTTTSLSNSNGSNTMEIISDGTVWRKMD